MNSRRRKDSHVLRVAERSNGLAFSHHHFLSASSSTTSKPSHSYILSQIDGNTPARPREKLALTLKPVDEQKEEIVLPIQQIRSLIPPVTSGRAKTEPNTIRRRRNSSSSASVKSFTSSMQSRRRKSIMAQIPTLATMPVEILASICQYLPQQGLHSLMLSNSNLSEVAAEHLYMEPLFASTYRFAQFTFIVVNCPHYAVMVRSLDLSRFSKPADIDATGEFFPLAGWREFKYRQRAPVLPCRPNSTHPIPSPLLQSFHRCRDVPIGGILHVLQHCTRMKHINFSRLQLASDFVVIAPKYARNPSTISSIPAAAHLPYPNYFLIVPDQHNAPVHFVSDVPKSWTWHSSELKPIYADVIIWFMCKLKELESVKAKHCVWLTTIRVGKLMREAWRGENGKGGLKKVDFRESGMQKGIRWAVRGSREEMERIVGEVVKDTGKNVA